MATTSEQVDVQGTMPLQVVPQRPSAGRPGAGRGGPNRFVMVKNIGPATAYLGAEDVTTDSGLPINSGGSFGFWLNPFDELWATTGGSLATVSYVETGGGN